MSLVPKILTTVVITIISTTCAPLAIAAEKPFNDVDSNATYQSGIEYLKTLNIISGNPDGTYKPNNTLNRAEMLKILTIANTSSTPSTPTTKCFNDVPTTTWYAPYICYGKEKGWVTGYDNGKNFKPEQTVTLVEGLKMSLQSFNIQYNSNTDIWYKGIVDTASTSNYIPFDVSGFNTGLRRDQMADMITRIMKKRDGKLSEYLGERAKLVATYSSISDGTDLIKQLALQQMPQIATSKQQEQTNQNQANTTPTIQSQQNSSIELIKKFSPAIVKLTCAVNSNDSSQGSGTLFFNPGNGVFTIFTNYHVIKTDDGSPPLCIVTVYPNSPSLTGALAYKSQAGSFKDFGGLDISAFSVEAIDDSVGQSLFGQSTSKPFSYLQQLALDGKTTVLCGQPQIGEKVFILGYPALGGDSITVTDGIIAGVENDGITKYYKTSAKVEHGNSGGAAILENGCFLGIPTLAISGSVESLAYILPLQ